MLVDAVNYHEEPRHEETPEGAANRVHDYRQAARQLAEAAARAIDTVRKAQ